MYKLLKKLRRHTEYLEIVIENIYSLIQKGEPEVGDENIKEIERCINKLDKIDLYTLFEAIFLTSANFNTSLLRDLEKKYSYLVMRWANSYFEVIHSEGLNIHDEYFQTLNWSNQVDYHLSISINKINRFCINYLHIPSSIHLNGCEYQVVARAHQAYHKERNRRAELKMYGVNALNEEDRLRRIVMGLNEEEFLDSLLGEDGFLDNTKFDENEMEIIMANEAAILNDSFEVCFVNERKLLCDPVLNNEESIFSIYKFLKINNIIGDVGIDYFQYIIAHKKLPNNSPQILWKGSMADARRMIDFFSLNDDIFNNCFIISSGKLIDKKVHKVKKNDTSDFSVLLTKLA